MSQAPPTPGLSRLDVPGMAWPWRLWKKLRGAGHRRQEVARLSNNRNVPIDLARAQVRTLVDIGLWNDENSIANPDDAKWNRRSFAFGIYSGAKAGICDSKILHMAFEGGLDRDFNEQNNYSDGWTTIFARTGQDDCLRTSLAAGCDVLLRDSCKETALHMVLERACQSTCPDKRARSLELADDIIQAGHAIDHPGHCTRRRAAEGHPVLQVPIHRGNVEVTRWLLERGARTDVTDGYGDFPMHWYASTYLGAGRTPSAEMAELLIEHGAALDIGNSRGETPLWMAVAWGNVEAVEWLLKKGANPTIDPKTYRDSQGFEKTNQPPVTMLLNVCKNMAPSEPVVQQLVGMILNAKPDAWDAPTPESVSIRKWFSTQSGPWRALHEKICMEANTVQASPTPHSVPRRRF